MFLAQGWSAVVVEKHVSRKRLFQLVAVCIHVLLAGSFFLLLFFPGLLGRHRCGYGHGCARLGFFLGSLLLVLSTVALVQDCFGIYLKSPLGNVRCKALLAWARPVRKLAPHETLPRGQRVTLADKSWLTCCGIEERAQLLEGFL